MGGEIRIRALRFLMRSLRWCPINAKHGEISLYLLDLIPCHGTATLYGCLSAALPLLIQVTRWIINFLWAETMDGTA